MTDRVSQRDRDARLHGPDAAGRESAADATTGVSEDRPHRSPEERNRSLWGDALHDLLRNPVFIASLLGALVIVSMAAFPWLWTGVDPYNCTLQNSKDGPTAGHPFGFTVQGCDMYAQVIYSARPSIIIAALCTAGVFIVGAAMGTLAAFYGTLADFWSTAVGRRVEVCEDGWASLEAGTDGHRLSFQQVENYGPPEWPGQIMPQQMHLDILVKDLESAEARVIALGATPLTEVLDPGPEQWRIYADPAGHPFCLVTNAT